MVTSVDSYISHHGEHLWDFEILSDFQYENVNRIHPLKQRDVLIIRDDSLLKIDASLSEVRSELDIIFHSKLVHRKISS